MLKIIFYITIGIILLSLLNFFLSIHPLKYKSRAVPSDFNLSYEYVEFLTKDNLKIKGWFIPSNYSKAAIIVAHGYPFDKGNVLILAPFLQKHYNLLFFDFRYFGESEGKYTTAGYKEVNDFLAAVEYLKTRDNIDDRKIGAIGFSLGASTILMSKSSDIKAIVADSAYANIDNVLKSMYFIFPGFLKLPFVYLTKIYARIFLRINPDEDSPGRSIKELKAPALLIHSKLDSQIPAENSDILYHARTENTELWLLENIEHGFSYSSYKEEYEKRVLNFFDRHLLS